MVLLVDHDYRYLDYCSSVLEILAGSVLDVLVARDVARAEKIISTYRRIAAITVDGHLLDTRSIQDACDFVKRVRKYGFGGQMIAVSPMYSWREKLIQAGCNHEVGLKEDVPQKLLEILGLLCKS